MRFEVPAEKQRTYEMVIPIRWGDMDAVCHVNNTTCFGYFEIARLEWLQRIGALPAPQGTGPVIVNGFCNFIRQVEFPGDLLPRFYVTSPGRSSFETHITLERTDQPDLLCAERDAKTVWTDSSTRKSAPLPDWLRALVD